MNKNIGELRFNGLSKIYEGMALLKFYTLYRSDRAIEDRSSKITKCNILSIMNLQITEKYDDLPTFPKRGGGGVTILSCKSVRSYGIILFLLMINVRSDPSPDPKVLMTTWLGLESF